MSRLKNRVFFAVLCFLITALSLCRAQTAEECNQRARTLIGTGNYAEAKELLGRAFKLKPEWAEPYFTASQLLRIQNKRDEMRRALKKAWELESDNPQYIEAYVKILKEDLATAISKKEKAQADSLRMEIIQVHPAELDIGAESALKLLEDKKNDEAHKLAKDLIDKNRDEVSKYRSAAIGELFYVIAKVEFENANISDARSYAERVSRYPIKEPAKAKELLTEVKQAQQKSVDAHLKQADSLTAGGQQTAAIEELQKALALDPDNSEAKRRIEALEDREAATDVFARAMKHIKSEKWLEARDLLERALTIDPTYAEAKKYLKQAEEYEDKLLKKLGMADRLPRNSKDRTNIVQNMVEMGVRFSRAKNYTEARVAFERAMAIIELDANLDKFRATINMEIAEMDEIDRRKELWKKATEAKSIGDFQEALKNFTQLPIDYNNTICGYLAESHWKQGDHAKAKEFASRQLSLDPGDNRAKFVLGNIYLEEGNKDASYKILKEIYDDDPDYPNLRDVFILQAGTSYWIPYLIPIFIVLILFWIAYAIYKNLPEYNKNAAIKRARSFLQKGLYKECIDELNLIKRLPILTQFDGALISRILAQAFLKTAVYDKAIGECKHLLSINPHDAEAHQWLGYAYLGRRMLTPESLPELLNLFKTESKNVALVSLLGQHYVSQKVQTNEGIAILERWLEFDAANPELLKTLGKYYLQKGKTDATSMKVFQTMLETGKAEPEFILGIAKLHLKNSNFDECLKLCEQVLGMDVNNELVHGILKEAYGKMEKLPELIEIYRAFLSENPYNLAFQKGLTEALKALEKAGGSQYGTGAPPAADKESEDDGQSVICPHCQGINSATEYYCQHCGKSIA